MNFDNNRAKYGLITVVSMLHNLDDDYCIRLHIIYSGSDTSILDQYYVLEDEWDGKLKVYDYDFIAYWNLWLADEDKVKLPSHQLNKFNYLVLASPIYSAWILPEWVDYVIHIDDDTIVNCSLHKLWSYKDPEVPYVGAFELSDKYTVINSGVTIHNLKYIRDNNLIDKMVELSNTKSYEYFEQELWHDLYFNILNKYKILPFSYNWIIRYQHHKCNRTKYLSDDRYKLSIDECLELISDYCKCKNYPSCINIIHYSRTKPWSHKYKLPLKSIWTKYKDITECALNIKYELVD